jgi:hypothetical protein
LGQHGERGQGRFRLVEKEYNQQPGITDSTLHIGPYLVSRNNSIATEQVYPPQGKQSYLQWNIINIRFVLTSDGYGT